MPPTSPVYPDRGGGGGGEGGLDTDNPSMRQVVLGYNVTRSSDKWPWPDNYSKIKLQLMLLRYRSNKIGPTSRVPYTFYVKRDGEIYFLVNRDVIFFIFVIRD